ncbi:MAG TPA: two-component regulator propeller domain-containing protein [Luteitalea sp.]|nr:two-component regulator propeller domain-containing protein [Luteitalea sp.]
MAVLSRTLRVGSLLVGCLWILVAEHVWAQPTSRLIVDHWQVEDGLPQNTVTSITQDDRGYLWVATRKGLARFDGAQFLQQSRVGDVDFTTMRLTGVLPDPDGSVWVSTYGQGVYKIIGDRAIHYGVDEGVPHEVVWDVSRDRDGRVWVSSSRGARFFDGRRWQAPDLPGDLATDGVNVVYLARDKRLWIATSRHGVISLKDNVLKQYSLAEGLPSATATSIAETPGGDIWVATPQGVARITGETITAFGAKDGLPAERVLQVLVDRRGTLWMATHGGGLVRYQGSTFQRIGRNEGLSTDYLVSLAEDRDGALWIGTLSGGLNRLAPAARELLDERSGLPPFPVTTIYQARDDTFWIGTFGGGLVSIRDGRVHTYTKDDGLPSNAITSVTGGDRNSVWVGTNGGGAFRFEDGRIVERVGPEIVGLSLRTIELTHASFGSGTVWFGGNGLVRYRNGEYRRLGEADGLRSNEVRVIYSVSNRVWVGTYGGGLQSIEADGRVRSWGPKEGLTNLFVTSLHHDRDDVLWIGTYGGGLFRLKNGAIRQVTTRDGLSDDVVFDVMEDDAGRLWLTGAGGLSVVRMADVHARMDGGAALLSVNHYGRAEGVAGTDGTDGSQPLSWLARDGRLWFATVEGVVIFDPTEVADRPPVPTVSIDAMQVDKRTVDITRLDTLDGRAVDITYSAPQLRGGRAVQYEYRLVGLDDAWVDAGTQRSASFTNLSPGTYNFEVRAQARRGEPHGKVRTLKFTVPARFFETPAFLLFGAGALGLAIVGLVRGRLGRLRRRQQELEGLVDDRTAALRHEMTERERAERERRALDERIQQAQRLESLGVLAGGVAHDFNNLLVGVLGEASLALGDMPAHAPGRTHVERIERAALRASELTAQMLAYSGRGRFIVAPVRLDDVVREVRELLGSVIPRSITVRLDFPTALPMIAGDPSQLRQVVMNLLTNAADAIGEAPGAISVAAGVRTLSANDAATTQQPGAAGLSPGEYVWLEVRDDGIGMDGETQARIFDPFFTTKPAGRGLGLAAVQGIVRSHGGRIMVASQRGAGSTFTLLLPAVRVPARGGDDQIAASSSAPVVRPATRVPIDATPVVVSPAAPGAPRVLVVDDERLVRDVARAALTRAGYAVTEVATGEQAVTLFEQARDAFDLVVLDLTLPGIQGRAVMQTMRAGRADVPILLTSGYTAEEAGDLTRAPRTTFLQKPWRPEQLLTRVRELLAASPTVSADRG